MMRKKEKIVFKSKKQISDIMHEFKKYTKEYLIGLILSGKIYKSGNGFYIDGIYYTPDYNNLTTIPRIKTKVNDILCDEK